MQNRRCWSSEPANVQTVWATDCLKVLAHGRRDSYGEIVTNYFSVELDGGDVLYESESYTAVQHFLGMLTEPYPEYRVA